MKVSEAKRLSPWEEGALTLIDLTVDNGFLIASDGKFRLCLPLNLKDDLAKYLGRTISILRTDSDYRMRILYEQS